MTIDDRIEECIERSIEGHIGILNQDVEESVRHALVAHDSDMDTLKGLVCDQRMRMGEIVADNEMLMRKIANQEQEHRIDIIAKGMAKGGDSSVIADLQQTIDDLSATNHALRGALGVV
jgi:hypothetical protein